MICPVVDNVCKIPVVTEELWMIAVTMHPIPIPRIGFENSCIRRAKVSDAASGCTMALMICIPIIRIANPISTIPRSFFRLSFCLAFERNNKITPAIASKGAYVDGFKKRIHKLSPCMPVRLKIHGVAVVPIFAPIITPTVCDSCMMPELTNPTTITVVVDELCRMAVTTAPSNTPMTGFDVLLSNMPCSLLPDSVSSPFPNKFIPYRKRARPPIQVNTAKISILLHTPPRM